MTGIPEQAHALQARVNNRVLDLLALIAFHDLCRAQLPLGHDTHHKILTHGRPVLGHDLSMVAAHRDDRTILGRITAISVQSHHRPHRPHQARVQVVTEHDEKTAQHTLHSWHARTGTASGWPITTEQIQAEAARTVPSDLVDTPLAELPHRPRYIWSEVWVLRLAQAEVATHHYPHRPHMPFLRLAEQVWPATHCITLDAQAQARCGLTSIT